jgi:enoyl-CoA hydratase
MHDGVKPEPVLYREQDGIAWITLNRPQSLNSMTPALLEALRAAIETAKVNEAVGAAIITGAGTQAFSSGADIAYLNQAGALEVRDLACLAVQINHEIETLGKPVIAAINGFALGGGLELAEACAIRLAVPHAQLGHPEVRIGAVAGFGGTTRLPRLIGRGRAAELLLTGRSIPAAVAFEIGLVNHVVEPEQLLAEAEGIAREILAQSPIAVRLTWEALHHGLNLSLEESARIGADAFGLAAATQDFKTGTGSFLSKTRPAFNGS